MHALTKARNGFRCLRTRWHYWLVQTPVPLPRFRHILLLEATTDANLPKSGVATDGHAACCPTISTGFFLFVSAGGGTVGTAGGDGNDSRFGVGDYFLDNSTSVRRILCPSTDAFLKYEEIHDEIKAHARKDDLILLALGATATVLAYDLAKEGFQALDIGHADIEYCWFMMDAREKVPVSGKAVNEVGINHAGNNEDIAYQSQIIVKIS